MPERRVCRGPLPRRQFLKYGALALGGISLADVLEARGANGTAQLDTSVILLYLHGGASQLETYDLKPRAPVEYRSIFGAIPTKVPGLEIAEHLPLHAEVADKFSIIRSMHHTVNIHSDGGIVVTTGKMPSRLDPTSNSVSEHPDIGSIVSHVRGMHPERIPQYVAMVSPFYFTRPSYLGVSHKAFVGGDPSVAGYRPPVGELVAGDALQRFGDRRALMREFDRLRSDLDQHRNLEGVGKFQQIAYEMLTNSHTAKAFDLSDEKPELREKYGKHTWGQSCLLARRLAERGSGVISVFVDSPANGQEYTNWDDHPGNAGRHGHFGGFLQRRLKFYDQAVSALVEDIYARGLDRKILVVATGEFGRTPRLSYNPAFSAFGRDHWPDAYSVLVSGGGLRMGQVIGATNSKAEYPTERPYTPQDLLATVYRHLGIDPRQNLLDYSGRPVPILNEGEPIRELV
ncbi:MAG: DUF1501 domain-containing protein [Planctomycetales bacterium]